MTDRTDPTPAALYARVSSDRQDVDLSVAAQLRAHAGATRGGGRPYGDAAAPAGTRSRWLHTVDGRRFTRCGP